MVRLHRVLTRRTDTLRGHSGQISFPGGRRDPGDESFTATALRETCEELGVCDPDIQVIGTLSTMYIPPSNFEVYPDSGLSAAAPDFTPNPAEVAEVFTFPLDALLDEQYKALEEWDFHGCESRRSLLRHSTVIRCGARQPLCSVNWKAVYGLSFPGSLKKLITDSYCKLD